MRIRLQGPGHASSLLSELNRCRQSRRFCDVLLHVGNRKFAAHRAILACAGSYFLDLFSRSQATPTAAVSLEFISPANLEKVLTFVYTGEILTDLIDVGVLYELAERLGISELVKACHMTFPDLQASVSVECPLESSVVPAAPSGSSSAVSCSSLSSSAAPTPAAPTPAAPLPRPDRHRDARAPTVKDEDTQLHAGYEQMVVDHRTAVEPVHSRQCDVFLPEGALLQLKSEPELDVSDGRAPSEGGAAPPKSSAQLACRPPPSSVRPPGSLQEVPARADSAERSVVRVQQGDPRTAVTEEEQWRQLADDIIELSDNENFMEEEEEEEEEDEENLVCVENGGGRASGCQVSMALPSCRACSVPLPADPAVVTRHAETHLTELGLCRLCGASFPDRAIAIGHTLCHMGVQLFTCDMCHQQFCSRNKLLHHLSQSASGYTLPQEAPRSPSPELQCAACAKTLDKDFQAVRDHALLHVCPQSLSCAVCHLPQLSLCSLLWHALAHLSVPVVTCPHCGRCFTQRPLLDEHMTAHAKEMAKGRGVFGAGGVGREEELQCFLCPQTFSSSSAFQAHLSLHPSEALGASEAAGGPGWLAARRAVHTVDCQTTSCFASVPGEVGGPVKRSSPGSGVGLGGSPGAIHSLYSGLLTNGSMEQDGVVEAAGIRGKWYRCRYCGKRFAHSGEFTYHLRIHTGEKPYQCKVCLRYFRGRSTLSGHLKTHAGALMYRCPVCGLFFPTLKLVSTHMELHKDQLPPDFTTEQTFMYNDHSKEPLPRGDT